MQKDVTAKKTNQLSRLIDVETVKQHGTMTIDVRASAEECAALAQRMGILEIKDLNAYLTLSRGARNDLFKIEGELAADVVQECCVTLAPIEERITDAFADLLTTSPAQLQPLDDDAADDDRPVELIEGDTIDIGEIVAQWLALALNPYPRSDAPAFVYIEAATATGEATQTPFAVLEKIKEAC